MRRLLLVVSLLLVAGLPGAGPAAAQETTGPPLDTDTAALDAALVCPDAFEHPERDAVLLVHGTGTNSEESWPWSLQVVLPAAGYDVCTVDLPERALVDQQVSAEYVVYAVRAMSDRLEGAGSDRKVDIIGHSQGTLEPRWALRWWPDVRAAVDDLIQLAPPNQGAESAAGLCDLGSCPPAVWQMVPGSAYLTAMNTDDPVPAVVDITAVVSTTDELVQPAPAASELPGAQIVVIQDLCPARYVGHVQLLADAVAVSVVIDALEADGPADPGRIEPAVCTATTAPGTDPVAVALGTTTLYANAAPALLAGPMTDAEPPLRPYASGSPTTQGPAAEDQGDQEPSPPLPDPGAAPAPTLPATGGAPLSGLGVAAAVAALALARLRWTS